MKAGKDRAGEQGRTTGRAQTTNDYLLGIVLVLLTIAAVFAFFPGLFQPFEEPTSSDEETMVDNLADQIVATNASVDGERTVYSESFVSYLSTVDSDEQKREQFGAEAGLQTWMRWNASIQEPGEEPILEYGDSRDTHDGPTANAVRFIKLDGHDNCHSGCQLVVRVW